MTLADTYANIVGVKLPYEPVPFPTNYTYIPEKYISVYTGGSVKSEIYRYYNTVLSIIAPSLQANNIQVLQVGKPSDYKIAGAIDYTGRTNLRQTAFVIENSLLHLGNNSIWNYIAGNKKIPFVSVCTSVPINSVTPFYKGQFSILGKSDNAYSYKENDSSIDSIAPETIANDVIRLLHLDTDTGFSTIRFGKFAEVRQIDYIPDFPIPQRLNANRLAIRLDIRNNFQFLVSALQQYRCAIVTNDPIPLEILKQFKDGIAEIVYFCDNNFNINFIKAMHNLGIRYTIISNAKDRELSDLKLRLFDYNPPHSKIVPDTSGISKESFFKTNRLYLGRGRFYPSLAHYKDHIDTNRCSFVVGDYIDNGDFLESWDYLHFYNKS